MNAVMDHLEHLIASLAGSLKLVLEGVSVLCILIGLIKTLQLAVGQNRRGRSTDRQPFQEFTPSLTNLRVSFGRWLSLALELQLGADIVNTTVAPSFEALGKLALLALIRTFLNFFLTKELAAEISASSQTRSSAEET
jgi:uncharacterized membrane protein